MYNEAHSLPEEEEATVPPGDDSNTDPTPPLPAEPGRNVPSSAQPKDGQRTSVDEEPEIGQERDIPSDGPDPEGERMIRDLEKPEES